MKTVSLKLHCYSENGISNIYIAEMVKNCELQYQMIVLKGDRNCVDTLVFLGPVG